MTGQATHLHKGRAMNPEAMTGQVIHRRLEVMIHSAVTTDQVIRLLQVQVLHPVATARLQAAAVAAVHQEAVEEVPTNSPRLQEEEDNYKTHHFTKF